MSAEGAIVVTGGTGGLGLGVCRVLQETGRPLVVTWVMERELDRAREVLGHDADLRRVDVTDSGELAALAADLDAGEGVWALAHLVGGYHDGDPVARSTRTRGTASSSSTSAGRRWRWGPSCPEWCGAAAGG